MIVVTGAAGFIGSNIIKGLNALGRTDILAVGDLTNGHKFKNLAACDYEDYMDFREFREQIVAGTFAESIEAIFHEGACSVTTEWDGRYMMENNYTYSKVLLHYCIEKKIPFLYASSAAVYGESQAFDDRDWSQKPLNVYGYSKWQFDLYVRRLLPTIESQVAGFRYFNVYGPHEQHKGNMASVAFHLMQQLREHDTVKLFEGSHGYGPGEQRRDFVFVDDLVAVKLWFFAHPEKRGIVNLGTGESRPFNAIAEKLIQLHGRGELTYIPFPPHLEAAYQSFTEANISQLREMGYTQPFTTLEDGLTAYYEWFNA